MDIRQLHYFLTLCEEMNYKPKCACRCSSAPTTNWRSPTGA